MRKRLIIGDIHGLGIVNDIYEYEAPDDVIILGDYFDSFNLSPLVQKLHFESLLRLREEHIKSNKGEFIFILGNHDYHYMRDTMEMYSGYNDETAGYVCNLVEDLYKKKILQITYIDKINRIIFSHAGVTNSWFNENCKTLEDINNVSLSSLRFTYRDGGDFDGSSIWNSPIWVRPEGLMKDYYKDNNGLIWNQIFGHTHNDEIVRRYIDDAYNTEKDAYFFNLDCLPNQYLIQHLDNDGKIKYNDFCNVDI
jgi:predicted phosphodiesterase